MKTIKILATLAILAAVPAWGQYKMTISQDCTKNGHENSSTKHWDHEYVDLGLPSGTKWATMDIGATGPLTTDGQTFYWGAPSSFVSSYVNMATYPYPSVLPAEWDAAHVQWGGQWRMPTKAEIEELSKHCTVVSGTNNSRRYCCKTDETKYIEVPYHNYWSSYMDNNKQITYSDRLANTPTMSSSFINSNKYYIRPVWGGNAQ